MKLLWQIVRKDLHKLGIPLALWAGFMVLRTGIFLWASGFFGAVSWEWLNYLQEPPAVMLRAGLDPLVVYFLAGWIVFADPLVERDAFWITRPISGGRLLAAKLTAAGLMFFVLPFLANLPWWLAAGLGGREIVLAAGAQIGPLLGVALAGMTVASVTDGFPRYVLWTMAGSAVVMVVQMTVAWILVVHPVSFGLDVSRLAIAIAVGSGVCCAVIFHQYVTRRLRRSVCLLAAGLMVAVIAGRISAWDFGSLVESMIYSKIEGTQPGDERIQVQLAGPPRFEETPYPPRAWIPIRIAGLPDEALRWVIARGEWSWSDGTKWSATGGQWKRFPQPPEMIRRAIHAAGAEPALQLGVPLSAVLAERMKRAPAVFHGAVDVHVHGRPFKIQLALHDQTVRTESGSFSIRGVRHANGTLRLDFITQRFALDRGPYSSLGGVALVGRADGAIAMPIAGSRFGAFAVMGSTVVVANHLEFRSPAGADWFDGAMLTMFEFDEGRVIERTLDINPFLLDGKIPASAVAP